MIFFHTIPLSIPQGRIERQLAIPVGADAEHVKTKYNRGVLVVTFPKTHEEGSETSVKKQLKKRKKVALPATIGKRVHTAHKTARKPAAKKASSSSKK
jgi:hypothetical protein